MSSSPSSSAHSSHAAQPPQLANHSHDSVTQPTQDRTLTTFGTFAMWLGANVVVTTILTGMFIVPSLSFVTAVWVIFLGSAVGILPLIMIGLMGQKTGVSTMMLAKVTFGRIGGNLPAIVNLLSLIAWSWIQALLAGMSLNYAVNALTGFSNVALFTVICEGLVVLIAIGGHRSIEKCEKIAAVVMILLALTVFYALFTRYDFHAVLVMPATGDLPLGVAIDIVIATAFSWIPLAADYNRHCVSQKAATIGTWSGYVLATIIAMGLGAAVSGLSVSAGLPQTYDPTQLLAQFGFGIPAALAIFFSVLTTNVMCVYSATLSYMSVNQKSSFIKPALVIGVLTILGSLIPGILDNFQNFLLIIGSLFIPAFALMIVDYFFFPQRQPLYQSFYQDLGVLPRWNWVAITAYAIGAVLAYYLNWVHPLSFGASLPVFVITGGLYYIGCRLRSSHH